MKTIPTTFVLLFALGFGLAAQEAAPVATQLPVSTAAAEGVSAESLAKLDQLVKELVRSDEIVGAEMMVIKNGRSILHQGYGWRDRESELPMETGQVFCVRSMTKPLIGASILMLAEEGLLAFDDPISKYLPDFDVDGSRDITIQHLLTHTSGLPLSLIMGMDLSTLGSIHDVAALGAGHALKFTPGSGFKYSDQGTDTLTALIEVVSETTAAEFVQTRLLDPLGMRESTCFLGEDHPLRARGCSKYLGAKKAWTRYWKTDQESLFPFFLGSQTLYSTLPDYARFLQMWADHGRAGDQELLSARSVQQAITPGPYPLGSPTGMPGLRADYGSLMQLWTAPDPEGEVGARKVVAYGHTGSDGTHAWMFPEHNAMVLYFTQSRGTLSGLKVEEVLGEIFLGVPVAESVTPPPLEQYLGYYQEDANDGYRSIILDGEDLAVEIVGKGVIPLVYMGEDRWRYQDNPTEVLAFERNANLVVSGYTIGDRHEYRFKPAADLPGVDEIAAMVAKAHRLELLKELGPMRLDGKMEFQSLGMKGKYQVILQWPDRFRGDAEMDPYTESLAFDGARVTHVSSNTPATVLEGELEINGRLSLDNYFARYGDWKDWHTTMQVIQKIKLGTKAVFMIRTGDTSASAATLFVDAESGQLLHEDSVTVLEGIGRVGRRARYGDFREVSGMLFPHSLKVQYPGTPMGTLAYTVTKVTLGVELPAGTFNVLD